MIDFDESNQSQDQHEHLNVIINHSNTIMSQILINLEIIIITAAIIITVVIVRVNLIQLGLFVH